MPKRLTFREYEPQHIALAHRAELTDAASQLKEVLRPRLDQFTMNGDTVAFQNLIGSFSLSSGDVAEVAPKVSADDWTTAVIHLLSSDTRLAVNGSQSSRPTARKNNLSAALALEYARRLESALHADGPLQVYERRHQIGRRLSGHLEVTRWMRNVALDPALFPVRRDELSPANDFTRGFSIVAGLLGRSVAGGELASRLRRLQSAIIPGHPVPSFVNRAVSRRAIPMQWRRYQPAWDIAAPLLRNLSVVGDPGHSNGLEVAVEPWPLLETLLERALQKLSQTHPDLLFVPKKAYPLLNKSGGSKLQSVEPDGLLTRAGGGVAATFEAKYTASSSKPQREHVFQALSTAAALRSPLSVIVYPGNEGVRWYEPTGFDGKPLRLVTIGLSMFSYRRGEGDAKRAREIGALLDEVIRLQPGSADAGCGR